MFLQVNTWFYVYIEKLRASWTWHIDHTWYSSTLLTTTVCISRTYNASLLWRHLALTPPPYFSCYFAPKKSHCPLVCSVPILPQFLLLIALIIMFSPHGSPPFACSYSRLFIFPLAHIPACSYSCLLIFPLAQIPACSYSRLLIFLLAHIPACSYSCLLIFLLHLTLFGCLYQSILWNYFSSAQILLPLT
jgi:hypothetical protein